MAGTGARGRTNFPLVSFLGAGKRAPTTSWEVAEALGGVAWESEQAEQLSYEELLSVLDCVGEVAVRCEHLLTNLIE